MIRVCSVFVAVLVILLTIAGDEYFDSAGVGGSNKDYHYLLRNCGSYLWTMIEKLDVEHGNMDDIVLAPPMKREVSFNA